MSPRKSDNQSGRKSLEDKAVIENAGIVIEQKITETLETNYMPYAMSVIVSRAIPEIDGFKPAHRKLLYTMYKMGLLTGTRTKSANIVGQTMRLNPHGDQTIYETMVRLARGNEALLHPYVESKGNFGKSYSRDMAYAAARYTEAKLSPISKELFADIDYNTVDFVDNYDNTTKEPTLLPVSFPSILVNSNMGIAVGMASSICPFNLQEICKATIGVLKNPKFDISTAIVAPDFPGGGFLLHDQKALDRVFETGRGSVRVRAKYQYQKDGNYIEVREIPPSTTVEAIIDKIVDLVRQNKVREVVDIRDETDLGGLKITIDLRRGTDPELLMRKLFQMTTLEDNFSCNFNILVDATPRVMGVREIIDEWILFRRSCVERRTTHQLENLEAKLHLLKGLEQILMDIDKAIKIVRETAEERDVIPNLMQGFGIDEKQADYVAEIRLRHLNREYILKRTKEIKNLEDEIAELREILEDSKLLDKVIINELKEVSKKYGIPRKTLIYHPTEEDIAPIEEEIPDYPVHLFFTKEGYFKKIVPQSLRMSSDHRLKEGDEIITELDAMNSTELLFFTDKHEVYKAFANEFEDTKASVMGDYIPATLEMDEGENAIFMAATNDFKGYMIFVFENGNVAKVEMNTYETKTRRKKLVSAYSDRYNLVEMFQIEEDCEILLRANNNRTLIFNTSELSPIATRSALGVRVMKQRKNTFVENAVLFTEGLIENAERFRSKNIPAPGSYPRPEDEGEQLTLIK